MMKCFALYCHGFCWASDLGSAVKDAISVETGADLTHAVTGVADN